MLGWVITCHDDRAQDMLDRTERKMVRWRNAGRSILARSELKHAEPHDV